MNDRPRADVLLPAMLEIRPKLTAQARARATEVRCQNQDPNRHLLAATVPTPYGVWVVWCGDPRGAGWLCAWLDDIPDPAALPVWCSSCDEAGTVDLSDPATPRVNMR
jgi:hypothetical protein